MEESGIIPSLDFEGDVLAAGEAENHAATDEQHRQRRDEGRHFQDRDHEAVDQPDRQTHNEAPGDGRPDAHVEIGRRENHAEDRRRQAERRPDRQIQLLVNDDEGHADREHAVARGVAQNRKERVGRSEKSRIEIEPARVEDRHNDEKADLPASEQEGSLAAHVTNACVVGESGHLRAA